MDRSSKACHAPTYIVRTTAYSRGPPNCSLFKECWCPRPQVGATPGPHSDSRKGKGEFSGAPPSVKVTVSFTPDFFSTHSSLGPPLSRRSSQLDTPQNPSSSVSDAAGPPPLPPTSRRLFSLSSSVTATTPAHNSKFPRLPDIRCAFATARHAPLSVAPVVVTSSTTTTSFPDRSRPFLPRGWNAPAMFAARSLGCT